MTLLSEIYDVTLKRDIRGAAKGGFVRPTVGEHFMTHRDFEEIVSWIRLQNTKLYTTNIIATGDPKIATLGANKICISYLKNTAVYTVIATIDGDNIILGDTYTVSPATTNGHMHNAILVFDSERIIYTNRHNNNPFVGRVTVGTVSDTSISFGTEQTYTVYNANYPTLTKIGNTQVAFTYVDGGDIKVKLGTVNTDSITFSNGASLVYNINAFNLSTLKMNDTTLFIAYSDQVDYVGRAIIAKINDTTITSGIPYTFYNDNIGGSINAYIASCLIAPNKVFLVYSLYSSYNLFYCIATITNTEISFSEAYRLTSSVTNYLSADMVDNKLVLIYKKDNLIKSMVGIIDGETVIFEDEVVLTDGSNFYNSTIKLTNSDFCTGIVHNGYVSLLKTYLN